MWIILRTSGRNTIPLTEQLVEAGHEAWTPTKLIRKPRSPVKRRIPMLPSFVFARASELHALIAWSKSWDNPFPDFSVWTYCGRIPSVSDAALEGLRKSELRAVPKDELVKLPIGSEVAGKGAMAGMYGRVTEDRGKMAVVEFSPTFRVQIEWIELQEERRAA